MKMVSLIVGTAIAFFMCCETNSHFLPSNSELGDTSQDRYRIPGSASSQSFRRNDYSSSPPTRGDSSNFSRGIHGRWDSRSSGRSDRDSESQSDWDSGKA